MRKRAAAPTEPIIEVGDVLLRAIWVEPNLRVVAAITTGVAREAARRHGAVGGPAAALGRSVTAGALLATLTKSKERLTAQLSGGGPIGPIVIDANAEGDLRAFIKNPGVPVAALPGMHVRLGPAVGDDGVVRVVRDLGLRETVSGQTTLVDGEIDTDFEQYLEVSEQVPSALGCEALLGPGLDVAISGGLLVQTLPDSDAIPTLTAVRERLRGGALSRALHEMTTAGDPPDPERLAETLLQVGSGDLLCLDRRPLRFFCPCTKERALSTLRLLSLDDLTEMVHEGRGAEVTCEFCRARHVINQAELEQAKNDVAGLRPS